MSFRRATGLLMLFAGIAATGCGYRSRPSAMDATSMGLRPEDTGCLSNVTDTLTRYFQGQADAKQITAMKTCAVKAFQVFAARTQGSTKGLYTPHELATFLEKYFLTDVRLSDAFLHEASKLKVSILGGSPDVLTLAEIERASELVGILSDQLTLIQPFMPMTPAHLESMSEAQTNQLAEIVKKAGGTLGAFFQASGQAYLFADIPKILDQAEALSPRLRSLHVSETVAARIPLIGKLKLTFIGPTPDGIASNEWSTVFRLSSSWAALWLRYQYWSRTDPISLGDHRFGPAWCAILDDGFSLIEESVARHVDGELTHSELVSLLDEFYHGADRGVSRGPDRSIVDFIAKAFQLKSTLVGGTALALVVPDLERAKSLVAIAAREMDRLSAILPLDFDSVSRIDEAKLTAAIETLVAVSGEVGAFLQQNLAGNAGTYSLSDLASFYDAERAVFSAGDSAPADSSLMAQYRKNLPLVKAAREILTGSTDADAITKDDWGPLLTVGAQWYGLSLRFHRFQKLGVDWMSGPGRIGLVAILNDAFGLLNEAIARHPSRLIAFEEIDPLIANAFPDGIRIGDEIARMETIRQFIRPFIQKFLGADDFGTQGRRAGGITMSAVERTRDIVANWSEGQHFLEAAFAYLEHRHLEVDGYSAQTLLKLSFEQIYGQPRESLPRRTVVAADEMRRMLSGGSTGNLVPLYLGTDREITFRAGKTAVEQRRHSFYNLSQMNWMRQLIRVLMKGYSADPARARAGDALTLDEGNTLYRDVIQFGTDVKIFDPSNKTVVANRFREGRLFTFASDGTNVLGLDEATELLAFLLSGKRLSNRVHGEIFARCPKTGKLDPYDYPMIEADCYRINYFQNVDIFWQHLPGLIAYYRGLPSATKLEFERNLELAARRDTQAAFMGSDDSDGFAMVVHYIESIYQRYDADANGLIDFNESAVAFPIFRGDLQKLSGVTNKTMLQAIFNYLLKYGSQPSLPSLLEWMATMHFQSLDADRGKIVQIFSALSSSPGPTGPQSGSAPGQKPNPTSAP